MRDRIAAFIISFGLGSFLRNNLSNSTGVRLSDDVATALSKNCFIVYKVGKIFPSPTKFVLSGSRNQVMKERVAREFAE